MISKKKTDAYYKDNNYPHNTEINLSRDIPMQVFEMIKIVLEMGLKSDEEYDVKNKTGD